MYILYIPLYLAPLPLAIIIPGDAYQGIFYAIYFQFNSSYTLFCMHQGVIVFTILIQGLMCKSHRFHRVVINNLSKILFMAFISKCFCANMSKACWMLIINCPELSFENVKHPKFIMEKLIMEILIVLLSNLKKNVLDLDWWKLYYYKTMPSSMHSN